MTDTNCPHCGAERDPIGTGIGLVIWKCLTVHDLDEDEIDRDPDCYDRELTRLRSENEKLRARLGEANKIIVAIPEWGTVRPGWYECRYCYHGGSQGAMDLGGIKHSSQCELALYRSLSPGLIPAAQPTEANESEGE